MNVYTTKQVAEVFQVSERTVFNWRKEGKLECLRKDGMVRFLDRHIEQLLTLLDTAVQEAQESEESSCSRRVA